MNLYSTGFFLGVGKVSLSGFTCYFLKELPPFSMTWKSLQLLICYFKDEE
jgi:hypothetical protein